MSPALNKALLDRLVADLGDDPKTVADIIAMFLTEAPANLAELKAAVGRKDAEAARRAAHTLKSTSLQLGAAVLSAKAKELEEGAREGRLPAPADVAEMESLWAAAKGELEQQRQKMAAA